MKFHTRVSVIAALLLASSCVSQRKYDDALAEIKFYQRAYQDLEGFQGELEAENTRLEGELAIYQDATPLEASYTADIDDRLDELRGIVSTLGTSPGDVTVLSVEGGYGLRLTDAILFDSGSDKIKPEGRELLLKMATEIAAKPYGRIWVRGHTDTDPVAKPETIERFPHGNLELSAARAIEVATLLAKEGGLDAGRVVVAGFGPNEPVAGNDSAMNKRKNRRVEIFVIEEVSTGR